MPPPRPIAVAISDLHLSLLQPACRADKDWLAVQAGYLNQVKEIADGLPVLCAGDLFDRWNAPPELINFALEHLPDEMICVPGQHDLPNHRMEEMHRSGYGVLKRVGKIIDISGKYPPNQGVKWQFIVSGFGWGQKIKPPPEIEGCFNLPKIALVHQYCWIIDHSYPGASEEAHLHRFQKSLKGYDTAVFGDNHHHFIAVLGDCSVLNVGGLLRRKSDEVRREPCVGVIHSDGSIKRKRLDTSADVFQEEAKGHKEIPLNMKEFIEGLEGLGEHGLNFKEAVENHLRTEEIEEEVKQIILAALENKA